MADMGDRANTLYFGDNLDILRHRSREIPTASVDLIYLDPPFNSNSDYNVIYKEQSGQLSSAQIQAFTDTWHWTPDTTRALEDTVTSAAPNVAAMLDAMVRFMGHTDLTAYLVMMTQRLIELHRVLKPTGSLYLHCDPTASHYLKIVLDTIFGPTNFRNEIVWERTSSHNDARRKYPGVSDSILFYTKSDSYLFRVQYLPYSDEYLRNFYRYVDAHGRRYRLSDLRSPNPRPNLTYDYKGYKPHPNGWAVSREKMEQLDSEGRLNYPKSPDGRIQLKRYLDEMPGAPVGSVWTDIRPVQAQAQERLGYPTQKPLALLERIITASSNPGDIIMDPFCGCGTAICAAQKLGRRWIGIDVTHLAVSLMKSRLKTMFDLEPHRDYQVEGEPKDVSGARELAQVDRYQFQYWAVSLIEAVAQEQQEEKKKKGRDRGIDGVIGFIDGPTRRRETVIVQVKSGHVTSSHIRDLKGVIEREKAAIGLYICLEKPTRDMEDEASSAGFYHSDLWPGPKGDHRWPRIQLRTIEDLLSGRAFAIPPRPVQFKAAERVSAQPAATTPGLWNTAPAASEPEAPDLYDIALLDSDEDEEVEAGDE